MDSTLEKIKEIIKPEMDSMGLEISDISWEKEGKYNYLKITLDKDTGIDIDMIVDATNVINPILDKYDLIEEEYILDISSKERG